MDDSVEKLAKEFSDSLMERYFRYGIGVKDFHYYFMDDLKGNTDYFWEYMKHTGNPNVVLIWTVWTKLYNDYCVQPSLFEQFYAIKCAINKEQPSRF